MIENDEATIFWYIPIQTDKEIITNRSDIVVNDKKERTFVLITLSVPIRRNSPSLKTVKKNSPNIKTKKYKLREYVS